MVDRSSGRQAEGWRGAGLKRAPRGEFFSLGGLLVPYVKTRTSFAPWTLSAAILLTLACWDPLISGGRFDAILFGLAAYELLIGLHADGGTRCRCRHTDRGPPRTEFCPRSPITARLKAGLHG